MCLALFLNNKSSKDRTKLLDGKEAEFYDNFSDINDLNIRPLVTHLISKCGQNAERSEIWLFHTIFRDLLFENVHLITKWPKHQHDTLY